MLADLAQQVLGIAREINLHTEADDTLDHLASSEITVMRYIDQHPGISAKAAAKGIGLQQSNTSVVLRNLVVKGMIKMLPDQSDGRRMQLFPTAQAIKTLKHHRIRWAAFLGHAIDDRADLRECVEMLRKISDALSAVRQNKG
jgi:DNA-binding MarR family transcriptional regulator